ncbi:MAG: TolC family protein [Spirochaetota bacterium]|nr:TolC family protein [Spirochaetota bacterium]
MWKYFLIFIFIVRSASSVKAQGVDYFLDMALKYSPLVKSQIHRMNAAEKLYDKESIFQQNPIFSIGYSNIPLSDWPALDKHSMSGISIGVSQYIASPWGDTYRKRTFYQKYQSEKESLKETQNLLIFQVQSAFHNILFLYKKQNILKENMKVLADVLRLVESLVSVNKMNSSHLLKLRGDVSALNNRIIELNGDISIAKADMERICGIALNWDITDKSIDSWIDANRAKGNFEGFHVENHPLYRKVYSHYVGERAAYQLEIAKLNPGVIFGFDYRIRQEIPGKDNGEDFLSFKASMPIPLYYALKERHSINAAKEKQDELKEILKGIEIELSTKWKGEKENYSKLLEAFTSYEKQVLPSYWSAYEAQIASLSGGNINLLDVLDAYRLYLNASLEAARLYRDLMISGLRLNYLIYKFPGKEGIDQQMGKH